jgi:hypothetical protein
MITECQCQLEGDKDVKGKKKSVAVLRDSKCVGMLDTPVDKWLTNKDLDDHHFTDVIWQSRTRVIMRSSGNRRLVQYMKADIEAGRFDKSMPVSDMPASHRLKSVYHLWISPSDDEMAVIFKDGSIVAKSGSTSTVLEPVMECLSWQVVRQMFDGRLMVSGISESSK